MPNKLKDKFLQVYELLVAGEQLKSRYEVDCIFKVLVKFDKERMKKYSDGSQIAKRRFKGGIESAYFDYITRKTNETAGSSLPVLGGQVPKNLNAEFCFDQFITTRENWVIQDRFFTKSQVF